MSAVKFFILTSAQYAAIDPKDDGTLYFVSDQNRIYKGTVPYSHPIELVDEFPATGLVGTLYVNTRRNSLLCFRSEPDLQGNGSVLPSD